MEALKDKFNVKVIYGHFEIIGGYKFWKHNPALDMSAEEQFNHNCDIDPNFRVLEPTASNYLNIVRAKAKR